MELNRISDSDLVEVFWPLLYDPAESCSPDSSSILPAKNSQV